jgi:hypothetical protein
MLIFRAFHSLFKKTSYLLNISGLFILLQIRIHSGIGCINRFLMRYACYQNLHPDITTGNQLRSRFLNKPILMPVVKLFKI